MWWENAWKGAGSTLAPGGCRCPGAPCAEGGHKAVPSAPSSPGVQHPLDLSAPLHMVLTRSPHTCPHSQSLRV